MLAEAAAQGPAGSLVVNVNVTVPAVISAALGVYTAVGVFLSGLKLAVVPPVHEALVAAPLKLPAKVTPGASAHTERLAPALTLAVG
jgi:hypothetical protein